MSEPTLIDAARAVLRERTANNNWPIDTISEIALRDLELAVDAYDRMEDEAQDWPGRTDNLPMVTIPAGRSDRGPGATASCQ